MAPQSCIVACLVLSFPLLATDPPTPADPNRPLTVQTTTTQTWIPGRWMRVENQDVWQPGHWETVQTTTTAPSLAVATPAASAAPAAAPVASATTWVSERWEQTPDGWIRFAGRWSNQSDVIVERRPIEPPTRTVVVERPVETVVERPTYTTSTSVSLGFGYGSPYVGVGFGYGTPYYGWGMGFGVPLYRPYYNHCYRPIAPVYPVCPAPVVRPPVGVPVAGGYVRHR